MLPAMLPVGLVFGLMSWSGEPLDIGTMLTASVALGISVDGTLHLLTWFRDAISRGQPRKEAAAIALQQCGPAMLQTNAVIGISLLAFYPAELLLISRFGWVMAALITTAFVSEVIFLPALLGGVLGRSIQHSVASQIVNDLPHLQKPASPFNTADNSSAGGAHIQQVISFPDAPPDDTDDRIAA